MSEVLPQHEVEDVPQSEDLPTRRRFLMGLFSAALVGVGIISCRRDEKEKPTALPKAEHGIGKTLKGESKQKKREEARVEAMELQRFETTAEIERAIRSGHLVRVTNGEHYYLDRSLIGSGGSTADKVAFCSLLPHTKELLEQIAEGFYAQFGTKLRITSLTRSVEYYERVLAPRRRRRGKRKRTSGNANASPRSSHFYGCTFDIGKKGLSAEQLSWLRTRVAGLEQEQVTESIEESRQACFHIMDRDAR